MSELKPCDCNNPFHDCDERAGCRVMKKLGRAQPAQAGQVLTRDDIVDAWMAVMHIAHATQRQDAFARAIEQAVMAKWVPMPTRRVTYTCPACHFSLERAE